MGPNLGYGEVIYDRGRRMSAHRATYTVFNGPIPEGMVVRHTCDRVGCVEPSHLLIGTHADNSRDAVERGRSASGDKNANSKGSSLVELARDIYAQGELTKSEVAERLRVSVFTVDKWTKGTVRNLTPIRVRDGRFKPTGQGCGTRAGYFAHQSRGEPKCEPCLEANRVYMRTYKANRYISRAS
jgi:hypothetical protein